ncbi:MAG: hypothetical protein ACREX3_19935 [Gammaproteobacteria bacterium]
MSSSLTRELSKQNEILGDKVLDFLFQTLSIDERWSLRDKTGFTWWPHRLAQRVWFEPVSVEGGSAYIRVHSETSVFRNVPNTFETAQRLDDLNRFASMNAFVWDTNAGQISSHFCAYVSDETFGWMKAVSAAAVGLQTADAHIKATEAGARLFNAELDESNHPQSGKRHMPDDMLTVIEKWFVPAGKHPYGFNLLEQMEPNPWVLATADESGFTAEFAFDGTMPAAGLAMTSAEGSVQTTLFQAFAEEQHPQLGNGILMRVSLPVEFTREQAIAKAHELNLAETHEHTVSYFTGAWCSAPLTLDTYSQKGRIDIMAGIIAERMKRPEEVKEIADSITRAAAREDSRLTNLCFVTFLPAIILQQGILEPFVWSMAVRSRWVKQHLSWH